MNGALQPSGLEASFRIWNWWDEEGITLGNCVAKFCAPALCPSCNPLPYKDFCLERDLQIRVQARLGRGVKSI